MTIEIAGSNLLCNNRVIGGPTTVQGSSQNQLYLDDLRQVLGSATRTIKDESGSPEYWLYDSLGIVVFLRDGHIDDLV